MHESLNCKVQGVRELSMTALLVADSGSDVIVATEHWFWPFESQRLSQAHPYFAAEVKTNARLTPHSRGDVVEWD